MALAAAIFTAVGIGANLMQYKHTADVIDENIKREEEASRFRAQDRRRELRKALAAQRLMAISQGSDADIGSNIRLRDISFENFLTDVERDLFETEGRLESLKHQKISAALRATTGVAKSLISYGTATKETTGGTAAKGKVGTTGSR
jgi:hypothetical protein